MDFEELTPVTDRVMSAAFEVANTLGPGLLEKIYQRAMVKELRLRGLRVASEVCFSVIYKGESLGDYFADLLVEDSVLVELKCVDQLVREHTTQCLNYLQLSRKKLCLLINFQRSTLQWKRVIKSA